jgi:hypothetical protein
VSACGPLRHNSFFQVLPLPFGINWKGTLYGGIRLACLTEAFDRACCAQALISRPEPGSRPRLVPAQWAAPPTALRLPSHEWRHDSRVACRAATHICGKGSGRKGNRGDRQWRPASRSVIRRQLSSRRTLLVVGSL